MPAFVPTCLQGHEQKLLKELALSREQLKRDLAAAKQELELVAGAADAAKEEAAAQINLVTQQLAAAQQRLTEAEKVRLGLPPICCCNIRASTVGCSPHSTEVVPLLL